MTIPYGPIVFTHKSKNLTDLNLVKLKVIVRFITEGVLDWRGSGLVQL